MRIRRTIAVTTIFIVAFLLILLFLVSEIADMTEDDRSLLNISVVTMMQLIPLSLIAAFILWALRGTRRQIAKSKKELLKEFNFAYLCCINNDPMNLFIVASNDTDLKIISSDGENTVFVELKKEFVDMTVEYMQLGIELIGKVKGIRITTKPSSSSEQFSIDLIFLDAKKRLNPPLTEKATDEAIENLCRGSFTQRN